MPFLRNTAANCCDRCFYPGGFLIAACVLYGTVLSGNEAITPFETIGMYAGAMTTTPGYGTALDAAGQVDYKELYEKLFCRRQRKNVIKDRSVRKSDCGRYPIFK